MRSQDCTGQVSGNGSPDASGASCEYDPHGSGAVDSFAVGDLPILVMERRSDGYLGTGTALAGCLVFFRLCLDFGGKEEILLNGWTDYLENEFAATKQSAVLETVQQTERQPVQAAQAGTGAAKQKREIAEASPPKRGMNCSQIRKKKRGFRKSGGHPPDRRGREQVLPEC